MTFSRLDSFLFILGITVEFLSLIKKSLISIKMIRVDR